MAYIADKIEVIDERVVFVVNVESQAAGSAQVAANRAEVAADRSESAMVGKLDSDMNPALLKFNYIGGSETDLPVLAPSVSGWDQVFREIGNTITLDDGRRVMVYTGYIPPYDLPYVGIAVSENYGPFEKKGINGDGQLIANPSEDPFLVAKDGVFYLYIEKKAAGDEHLDIQLFTANSIEDLLSGNLADRGVVLNSDPDSWEARDVSSPTVLVKDDNFLLFYEGRNLTGNSGALGLAYSVDGINFLKEPNNPLASGTQIDSTLPWASHLIPDDILYMNGLFYLTVHARNPVEHVGGMLVSSDLINWKDYLGSWVPKEDGKDVFGSGFMIHYEERFKQLVVHYLGVDGIMKGYLTVNMSGSGGKGGAATAIKTIAEDAYSLLIGDVGFILHFTSANPVTVIVPLGLSSNSRFEGKQKGAGKVTFVADAGVTLNHPPEEKPNTSGIYSPFALDWTGSNTFVLYGRLELL